jgi:hypothetical protein
MHTMQHSVHKPERLAAGDPWPDESRRSDRAQRRDWAVPVHCLWPATVERSDWGDTYLLELRHSWRNSQGMAPDESDARAFRVCRPLACRELDLGEISGLDARYLNRVPLSAPGIAQVVRDDGAEDVECRHNVDGRPIPVRG